MAPQVLQKSEPYHLQSIPQGGFKNARYRQAIQQTN